MLEALSPSRRRFALAVACLAAVLVVAAVAGVLRSRSAGQVHPVAQDTPGPVLLVPGYGGSTAALRVLADTLGEAGRDVVLVQTPDDGTGDLATQAEALNVAAEAAIAESGADSVDVVGYSAGGVVARLWVAEHGGGDLARRIVTLGSPQHGTDVAGLAVDITPDECPAACRQLAPGSDLLLRLNAGDETPAGPAFVSVWTSDDNTVTPPDSAELDGALNIVIQDVCTVGEVSHGDLPRTESVMAIVLLELRSAAPVEPTSSDCALLSS